MTDDEYVAISLGRRKDQVEVKACRYHSDFARGQYIRGYVGGVGEALLAGLHARGIDVPEPVQARITGCTDLDQLDLWIARAATAISIDDLQLDG